MDIATTPRPLEGLPAWTRDEFEAQLRDKGRSYHIHHPFNVRMNAGGCMPDRAHRRLWVERILDHDGYGDFEGSASGGLEAWIRLGEAVGIARDDLLSLQGVVPAVRFACDAYVNFAAKAPWQEAVCSSLTEMFAPQIHKDRLATWPTHYPWINADGLGYFRKRIPLAGRDVEHGLRVTLDHFTTRAEQHRALDILQFKLDVLWTMLDAIEKACQ